MENPSKLADTIKFDVPTSSNSKLVFIFVAFVILLFEIGFLLWFVPGNFEETKVNSAKIEELTKENGKLANAVDILESADSSQISEDLFLAESALPNEKRVTGLVSALTNLASSSGVTIDQIDITFGNVSSKSATKKTKEVVNQFSDSKLKHDVVGVPIILEVAAPDSELLDLVGNVQQALPLLDIRDITFKLDEGEKSGKLSVLVFSQPNVVFDKSKLGQISALNAEDLKAISSLSTKRNILQ